MTTDLPSAVRASAAIVASEAHWGTGPQSLKWPAVVDAVTAVVAEEIARPLQARITELEAEVAARKRSGEALNTECEQIGDKADEAWRALNPCMARVELLTAALTGLLDRHDNGWKTPGVMLGHQVWENARAALAAGETESEAP